MKTVLLVIETEAFGQRIKKALQKDFQVLLCHDAYTAAELMEQKPDGMVLQVDLPGIDGLTFLEDLTWKPKVILSLALNYSPYAIQRLRDLGVGYSLRTPCALRAVTDRLRDMMRDREIGQDDHQDIAASHLHRLGISSLDGGGKQLRVAIPLYAQDPNQKISLELYPVVAGICGSTVSGVEHTIRRTIQEAWMNRDAESWAEYFPKRKKYPPNKVFISTLAEKLY